MTIATNGIQMHVVETGTGRPLVFLHGLQWTEAKKRNEEFARFFA